MTEQPNQPITSLRVPLFRTVRFLNMSPEAKKPVEVSVRVLHANIDNVYVKRANAANTIVGFQDPETGFFITKLHDEDTTASIAHNRYRQLAMQYAQDAVDEKIAELKQLHDEDKKKFATIYKPLKRIINEMTEYLEDGTEFYIDLDRQINVIKSNARPHVNEFIAFDDDEIDNSMYVTTKVDYLNPDHQTLTDDQIKTVETFLAAFVDDENRDILSWYLGAMLLNVPIYDERISKMMIVTSNHGGSGKSTLFAGLTKALLGDEFCEIKSSFDDTFMRGNRFGTSQILPVRMVMYSEAEFNDGSTEFHNFDGLNVAEIKSMISDGYVSWEKKYADMQTQRLSSFHVVLTNHAPEIDADRQAMNRRLLPLVIRPTSMVIKGKQLHLESEPQVFKFLEDNKQAFANYFVDYFKRNQREWTNTDYDYTEVNNSVMDATADMVMKLNEAGVGDEEVAKMPYVTALRVLGREAYVDDEVVTKFIEFIDDELTDKTSNYARVENGRIYINSTKKFFSQQNMLGVRDRIKAIFGAPSKKFGGRMFKLNYK